MKMGKTWVRAWLALVGLCFLTGVGCQFDQGGIPFADEPDAGEPGTDPAVPDPMMPEPMPPVADPCAGGMCECPLPLEDCSGTCVDLTTDDDHCGSCDKKCKRDQRCRASACHKSRSRESCEDCNDGDLCEPQPDGTVECIEVGGGD